MRTSRRLWLITWLVIIVLALGGCDGRKAVYLTIDDKAIYEDEVILYLLQTYNEFEQLVGEDVWEITDFSGGKSASDVAKQGALDNLIMTGILAEKASEAGIVLDENQVEDLAERGQQYFDNLEVSFVERYGITEETVNDVLRDNQMASLFEQETKFNYEVTPEEIEVRMADNEEYVRLTGQIEQGISDLLTIYTVEHIIIYTHTRDSDGNDIPKSADGKAAAKERIEQASTLLMEGADFTEMVKIYSEDLEEGDAVVRSKLTGLQLPDVISEALEQTSVGEITEIIAGQRAFHIFKVHEITPPTDDMITEFETSFSNWKQELYNSTRQMIISEGFERLYAKWRESVSVELKTPWSEVDILNVVRGDKEQ